MPNRRKHAKLVREKHKTREEWLSARQERGIGASESAVVAGISPFMSSRDLWKIKALGVARNDISDNPDVMRGVMMEPALRSLYKATHPDCSVAYHQFDILYQQDIPFVFATLDGEIRTSDNLFGILEIKTAYMASGSSWLKWKNQIPPHYYTQICHQLIATGFDFAVLYAALIGIDGDMAIREYRFSADDCREDMDWLLGKERLFYDSVQNKTIPDMTIML